MNLEYSWTKIAPLGKRDGFGTYDTIWRNKLNTFQKASQNNDVVIIDFVKNEQGIIYFKAYHLAHSEEALYEKLDFQYFPAGLDTRDDRRAMEMARKLFEKFK